MTDYDYDPSIWTKESITTDGLKNIIGEQSKTIAAQAQTIAHLKTQNEAKDARIAELEAALQIIENNTWPYWSSDGWECALMAIQKFARRVLKGVVK
jgi:cell division protein FtsB